MWPRGSWRPPWERRWPGGEASDRKRQPPRPPLQFQALRRAVPGPLEGEARYAALTAKNHAELAAAAADCTDLLLVFPLYADGLPAPLLRFLEFLEGAGPEHRPRISVLINCGFLEPHQNDVAVDMVRLFCLENGYPFGACLKIGGGEAILGTPSPSWSGGASGRWPGPSPPDGPPSWRSPCPCPPLLCAGLHTLLDADGRRQRLYAGTDGVHGH
ncbi:MAG: hypothetical protein ACLRNQ_11055 [Flavonifractor plautii]